VLLVAHAGSINGMISILTKEPFDKLVKNYWEKIKHGSLTSIKLNEKKVIIEYIGK
jgi:broad specificity phosphatase PhoE